jgi:hypothetical protein
VLTPADLAFDVDGLEFPDVIIMNRESVLQVFGTFEPCSAKKQD